MGANINRKTHLKSVRFRGFVLNTFNIEHQLLTEVWTDGSILVESPLLPVLPVLCPEGNFGPRQVSAPNDIQTGIVGLKTRRAVRSRPQSLRFVPALSQALSLWQEIVL